MAPVFRKTEVFDLKGDPRKAKKNLKWTFKTNLNQLIKIMIDAELKVLNNIKY